MFHFSGFLGFILWVAWVGLNVMVVGLCCFSPESLWDFLNFFSRRGEVSSLRFLKFFFGVFLGRPET